jgi:hypothetical protein
MEKNERFRGELEKYDLERNEFGLKLISQLNMKRL